MTIIKKKRYKYFTNSLKHQLVFSYKTHKKAYKKPHNPLYYSTNRLQQPKGLLNKMNALLSSHI